MWHVKTTASESKLGNYNRCIVNLTGNCYYSVSVVLYGNWMQYITMGSTFNDIGTEWKRTVAKAFLGRHTCMILQVMHLEIICTYKF